MDVILLRKSAYELPSKRRVGAIAHDGAADMQLWPGPGADRDLRHAYGDGLQAALDKEIRRITGGTLPVPGVCRVHPGRLHCDFLAWCATRPPEPGENRQPAPNRELLRASVFGLLSFVAQRSVERVAIPALGEGPEELARAERLVDIVSAAHAYSETCFREGRPSVVEEVLVCEPQATVFRAARTKVSHLARVEESAPVVSSASKRKASTKTKRARGRSKLALPADEVASARVSAEQYNMRHTYQVGDWLVHSKFGVGQVREVHLPNSVLVLFEDGSPRKMVHARGER